MRICVITDVSKGAEMRPDGGRQETSSFHAAFRLTAKRHSRVKQKGKKGEYKRIWGEKKEIFTTVMFTLTGKNNEEDDGNVNEEELKVSKVAEDLKNNSSKGTKWDMQYTFLSYAFLWKPNVQNRAEWRWCTGWCCTVPWTWRHRRKWWGQHAPPCQTTQTFQSQLCTNRNDPADDIK